MNYNVTNIRLAGNRWLARVEYWTNCQCTSQVITAEVYKDRRPTKKDFILSLDPQDKE